MSDRADPHLVTVDVAALHLLRVTSEGVLAGLERRPTTIVPTTEEHLEDLRLAIAEAKRAEGLA